MDGSNSMSERLPARDPPSIVYEAFGETKMNQNHKVGKLILADGTVLEGYLLL